MLVMDETVTAISNDHLIEVRRVPIIAVLGYRFGWVGAHLILGLSDLTEQPEGAVFSAEGLPGWQFTNNGYRIEGTPTQAGNYRVKIMAENRYGSAVPFMLNLKDLPRHRGTRSQTSLRHA